MENIRLIPHILPSSELAKTGELMFDGIGTLKVAGFDTKFLNRVDLFLCSDTEPIKEGDWMYNHHLKIISKGKKHFRYDIINRDKTDSKILFTTDLKLIADGVGKIDGNTKAFIRCDLCGGVQQEDVSFCSKCGGDGIEVNLLTEFCKRYNQKDKGYDFMKPMDEQGLIQMITHFSQGRIGDKDCTILAKSIWKEFNQKDKGVDVERQIQEIILDNCGKEYGTLGTILTGKIYADKVDVLLVAKLISQSLQSTGQYSLEDMSKAIELLKLSAERFNSASFNENAGIYEDYAKEINKFIQSLQPQSKGEIVIECNDGNLIFK